MNNTRLIESEEELAEIVRTMRTVAVIGMGNEEVSADRPAFQIPRMMKSRGLDIIPVNPNITSSLGIPSLPDITAIPEGVDVIDIFRLPRFIVDHARQIISLPPEKRPRVVWLQSGIVNDEAADMLAAAGIPVVMDRCLGVYVSMYRPRSS